MTCLKSVTKKVAYTLLLMLHPHPATHSADPILTDITSTTQDLHHISDKNNKEKNTLSQIKTAKKKRIQTIAKKTGLIFLFPLILSVTYYYLKRPIKVKIGKQEIPLTFKVTPQNTTIEEKKILRLAFKVNFPENNIFDEELENHYYYLSVSEKSHVKADLSIKAVGMLKQGGGLVDEFEVTVVKPNDDNKTTPTPHHKTNGSDHNTKESSILKLKIKVGEKDNIKQTFETEVDLSGQIDKITKKTDYPEYQALTKGENCPLTYESISEAIRDIEEKDENNNEFPYVLSHCCKNTKGETAYRYYSLEGINEHRQTINDPNYPCPVSGGNHLFKYRHYATDLKELKKELEQVKPNTEKGE